MVGRTLVYDALAEELGDLGDLGGRDGGDDLSGAEDVLGQLACHRSRAAHLKPINHPRQPLPRKITRLNRFQDLRPAGTNTVLPSSEPLYFLSPCSAVRAARGREAASAKGRFFGLRATNCSGHLAYSPHAPT